MGILALYSKIDSLQREDHFVTVAEVKEVMDDAIRHSQKASAKKLMRKVFGRNTDESDRITKYKRNGRERAVCFSLFFGRNQV